jgi:HEAT repeat protein
MVSVAMNEFEERLLDLGLEELLGGIRPPRMSDRILKASAIEELPTHSTVSTSPLSRQRYLGRILTMVASFLFCVGVFWTIIRASLFGPQQESARQAQELVEKLRSEHVEERQEAARKLKDLGKAALSELEKASRDKDPEVATQAKHILNVVALRETLSPGLWKDLPGMEDRLAEGGHAWTEVLLDVIRKDTESDSSGQKGLTKNRLNALAGPGLREARTADEKEELCLFLVNSNLRGEGNGSSAVPELPKLLRDKEYRVRSLAAMALGRLGAKETVPEIARLLTDGSGEVRKGAVEALGYLGVRETIPEVVKLLGDGEARVRSEAVDALGRLGAKETAPEIVMLLKDGDAVVRRVSLNALANLGARSAAPEIAKVLEDGEAEIRTTAVHALRKLGARETAPGIAKLLTDESADVRCWTVYALGQLDAKETAPAIAKLLTDVDVTIRIWGAQALGKMGAKETAPELRKLLTDGEARVRYSAASSLCRFGLRDGTPVFLKDEGALSQGSLREVGYVGLGNLNAIRQPEVWSRLERTPLNRDLKGTLQEVAEGLARETGLSVVIAAEVKAGKTYEVRRHGRPGTSLLEGLELFINNGQYDKTYGKFEVILEPDRIRILPRGEALSFWLAWWRGEEKNK